MKRYIRSTKDFDYNRLIVNNDVTEDDNLTIADAIDMMCYNTYEEYYNDYVNDRYSFGDLVDVVLMHLDDPDIYGLKVGKDYSRKYVEDCLEKYI